MQVEPLTRVPVKPELIQWACERAGCDETALARRFPKLGEWQSGRSQPTLKQLEAFAKATHTSFGHFFLLQPPIEQVPIPDFRTIGNNLVMKPTPGLLDTIYICQQRQEWYREYARISGDLPVVFIGSSQCTDDIVTTAGRIRKALKFGIEERQKMATWNDAFRHFVDQADAAGVLVMASGVVGSNNKRNLSPDEFRGFALSDPYAPLVFINGADTKAAQIFTLAHELAHLWLGESALSDAEIASTPANKIESWCNKVAAEMLVPLASLKNEYRRKAPLNDEVARLARLFKVSTLVILRRIHDGGGLTREQFWAEYKSAIAQLRAISRPGGGDFYLTATARVGKRFARAVVSATLEGHASFSEMSRLLGIRKMSTFQELGDTLGIRT